MLHCGVLVLKNNLPIFQKILSKNLCLKSTQQGCVIPFFDQYCVTHLIQGHQDCCLILYLSDELKLSSAPKGQANVCVSGIYYEPSAHCIQCWVKQCSKFGLVWEAREVRYSVLEYKLGVQNVRSSFNFNKGSAEFSKLLSLVMLSPALYRYVLFIELGPRASLASSARPYGSHCM